MDHLELQITFFSQQDMDPDTEKDLINKLHEFLEKTINESTFGAEIFDYEVERPY